LVGLFERAGYYTLLSFAVVYLGELGFGHYWPGLLVGSGLGVLVYGLPVLSGALADRVGFRRALLLGSVLLLLGYLALAAPIWVGGRTLEPVIRPEVTVGPAEVMAVLAGLLLVAIGRSLLTPTCAGLVHEQAGGEEVIAFGIFYTMAHAGNLGGRVICWLLRSGSGLEPVFEVAAASAGAALLIALTMCRGSTAIRDPGPSPGRPFRDLVEVLREARFRRFILTAAVFFVLFTQIFILLPLYLKTVVETNPALELYGAILPLVAVACQLPISRASKGLAPVRSIALGTCILSLGMLLNLPPLFLEGGPRASLGGLPVGSLAAILAMGCASLGSLLVLPRVYEYMGSQAPAGREGMFLGIPSLTMALGQLAGGALGPVLLHQLMVRGAGVRPDGLLDPAPWAAALGWILLAGLGLVAAGGMWLARDGGRCAPDAPPGMGPGGSSPPGAGQNRNRRSRQSGRVPPCLKGSMAVRLFFEPITSLRATFQCRTASAFRPAARIEFIAMTPLARILHMQIRRLLLGVTLPARLWAAPHPPDPANDPQVTADFGSSRPCSEEAPGHVWLAGDGSGLGAAGPGPAATDQPLKRHGDRFASWVSSRELVYPSRDDRGAERLYSGRVYLPSPWLRRSSLAVPLVVYVHGTETEPDQVPQFNRGGEAMVGAMAAYFRNFAVAMPDLPGCGKDPSLRPHPFCQAKSLAFSVLDMIAPALRLLEVERRRWDGRIFIVGYSSGGYGAMAAVRELHTNPSYAWIPLAGAACMAGPFHFAESTRALLADATPYHRPDIQVLLLHAYHDLYPEQDVFSPGQVLHAGLLESRTGGFDQGNVHDWLRSACSTALLCQKIKFRLTGTIHGRIPARGVMNPDWVRTQLLSPAWPDTPAGRILMENDLVGGWQPKVPMLLATSPTDECVPASNTYDIMEDWAQAGCTRVEFYPLTLLGVGVDHSTGAALALAKAFSWLRTIEGPRSVPLRSRL
jgi:dipeptide/tripeptide permease/poly(3-hydroxybutyrate) depolymerase